MLKMKKSISERSFQCKKVSLIKLCLVVAIFLAATLLLVACSTTTDPQPPATAPAAEPAWTSLTSAEIVAVPSPTLPPSPQPSLAAEPPQACLPPGNPSPLVDGPFDIYPPEIFSFLNGGGSAKDLDQALYSLGIANLPVPVGVSDMTGDGIEDVVVSIFDPRSVLQPPAGLLLIYICDQQGYRLAYQEDTRPNQGAPGIRYLQDMNADGISDLVLSSASCGAHTCFERVQLISWEAGEFINRLVGETIDLPYPTIYLEPAQDSGIYDLHISGSGLGSVGAGPQRNITRVWTYEAGSLRWLVSSVVFEPSSYRIHVLHDANSAFKNGEFKEALLLYNRAISDSTLQDWSDPAGEQAWITSFARYQLVVLYTLQDQGTFANLTLDEMNASISPESQQHGYFEMATLFLEGFRKGGVEEGCAAAIEYAAAHTELLEPLGPQVFGYGNPPITPEQVCP